VLHFGDSLEPSFNALMKARGLQIKLGEYSAVTHHHLSASFSEDPKILKRNTSISDRTETEDVIAANHSVVKMGDIDSEVARLVRCAYSIDLCLFNFDPATGESRPASAKPLADSGCWDDSIGFV
jgi:hypothetical protein